MRKFAMTAALALIVVPSAVSSPTPTKVDRTNGAQDCRALRTKMGLSTFKQTYGTAQAKRKNAFGRCVSKWAREEHENRHNAAQACRAEREELGVQAFRAKYGTGPKKANAFGRCVSMTRRAESRADPKRTMNAAQTCKAEREKLGVEAFRAKYGTNDNDRNAFGKCVSALAKAQNDEKET